jgi:hypothetical protein
MNLAIFNADATWSDKECQRCDLTAVVTTGRLTLHLQQ